MLRKLTFCILTCLLTPVQKCHHNRFTIDCQFQPNLLMEKNSRKWCRANKRIQIADKHLTASSVGHATTLQNFTEICSSFGDVLFNKYYYIHTYGPNNIISHHPCQRKWLIIHGSQVGLNERNSFLCVYRQVLLRAHISYGDSVCLSVCLSQPGTESSPGEIETPGFHRMVA